MKRIFSILIFLFLSAFSCRQFLKNFEVKIHDTEADIEIKLHSGGKEMKSRLKEILNYRFDKYMIYAKYDISNSDPDKLMIKVKNYKNLAELRSLLEYQGKFEIVSLNDDDSEKAPFVIDSNQPFVKKASAARNFINQLCLNFELKDSYKKAFGDFTGENIGRKTAFKLDDQILFKPVIREKISDGNIQLTLPDESGKEKLFLYEALLLSGQLPFRLDSENLLIKEIKSNSSMKKNNNLKS